MELEKKFKGKLIFQIRDVDGDGNDFKDVLRLLSKDGEIKQPLIHKFIKNEVKASGLLN